MFNMGLLSNLARMRNAFAAAAAATPALLASLAGRNVDKIFEDSKKNLQSMVYDQPPTPSYVRTGDLMRGHRKKRLGFFTWVIYNDEGYASYVHDGTSRVPPRPWIQNAIDANMAGSNERILNGVNREFDFDAGPPE